VDHKLEELIFIQQIKKKGKIELLNSCIKFTIFDNLFMKNLIQIYNLRVFLIIFKGKLLKN